MKKSVLERIDERVFLLDGAMGTLIMSAGIGDEAPESWNLTRPETISGFHKQYFEAGADAVLTNTFGANRIKLSGKGLEKKVFEINLQAVKNAKSVCPEEKYVAGDIGPTGKFLKPVGEYSENEFIEVFEEQADALLKGGVDFFIIETMFDKREALCALKAIRKITQDIPVFTSMTFNKGPKGFRTVMGDNIETSFKSFEDEGTSVVGSNCSLGSKDFIPLVREMRKYTKLPLLAEANAGQPVFEHGKTVYKQSPEEYSKDIPEIISSGAKIVGGCCGTTPEFIKKIYETVFQNNQKK
ncbi:hypothetical protein DRQ09_05435 [candidate division KSB1 bacterium]|nr:MAG: hypothetical protein DRQ09_05435 [candidate division KSB1 bacterium]